MTVPFILVQVNIQSIYLCMHKKHNLAKNIVLYNT